MKASRPSWSASQLQSRQEHRLNFDEEIVDEVNRWIDRCPEVVEDEVTAADVDDMPHLRQLARCALTEMTSGSGVARIQPPPVDEVEDAFLRRFYLAFGVHLGTPLGNYGRLYDVKDRGGDYTKTAIPVSQTRASTQLHTDSSAIGVLPDLVGLICIRPAMEGGESRIACAIRAYERLESTQPQLLQVLEQPHVRDIVTPGADQSQRMRNQFPVFDRQEKRGIVCRYMRFWIEKGYEKAQLQPPSRLQEALDALDDCLAEEEAVANFPPTRGESLWVENTTTLHDRTEYTDDPAAPRLLLRQWVSGIYDCQ